MVTIDGSNLVGGIGRSFNVNKNREVKKVAGKEKKEVNFEKLVQEKSSPEKPATSKEIRSESTRESYNLSQEAQLLKEVMDRVSKIPDVRREKIERLKELIRKGLYDISPSAVAKKMLEDPEVAAKLLAPIRPEEE